MNPVAIALYALWAALAGGTIPVMAALSGSLGRSLQSPIHASGVTVLVAVIGIGVALHLARFCIFVLSPIPKWLEAAW